MSRHENKNLSEKEAIRILSDKYGFKENELQLILRDNLKLPVSIIKNDVLSPLESIVKYLRENKDLTYRQIGKLLSRDPKTLAVTYSVAQKKAPEKLKTDADTTDASTIYIDFSIFGAQNKELSILEGVCYHLKNSGMNYSQISRILGKNQKTIWTVCKRAEKKLLLQNNNPKDKEEHE